MGFVGPVLAGFLSLLLSAEQAEPRAEYDYLFVAKSDDAAAILF
jgi:hypothetical protein